MKNGVFEASVEGSSIGLDYRPGAEEIVVPPGDPGTSTRAGDGPGEGDSRRVEVGDRMRYKKFKKP